MMGTFQNRILLGITSALILSFAVFQTAASAEQIATPNIIFMLSDDQNWNGTSVQMHPDHSSSKSSICQTPNLEKLAAQGMRFSAAYAPAPVCSPTRISLQTGKSPAQLRWTKAAPTMTAEDGYKLIPPSILKNISGEEVTIAELLRQAGYATAHYGKWHLQGGGPGKHGYDEHDGDIGNEYAQNYPDPNPVDIFGMAERAEAFMEKSKKAGKPFFIQMSWHALHAPQNALKKTVEKYEKLMGGRKERSVQRAALAEDLDTGVGMVVDAVDRLGLAGDTYVIYMSDNGGGGSGRRSALSGGKGSVWEGGIRVPLIVRGPGVKENSWCHERVNGYDFIPTYCEWARIKKLPEKIEGGSIASLLANEGKGTVTRPREEMVFHFPHYQSADGPHSAILLGDLKLLKFYDTGRLALFDLSRDIGERNDLSKTMPDETTRLAKLMEKYLDDVGAALPVANPKYDPKNPPAPPEKGPKGEGRERGLRKKGNRRGKGK